MSNDQMRSHKPDGMEITVHEAAAKQCVNCPNCTQGCDILTDYGKKYIERMQNADAPVHDPEPTEDLKERLGKKQLSNVLQIVTNSAPTQIKRNLWMSPNVNTAVKS